MFKHAFFALVLFAQVSLFAATSQGEILERQYWDSVRNQKWNEIESKTAPSFQIALFDKIMNKERYLRQVKTINISDYTLSDISITEGPGTLVITYSIALSETIDGERLSSNANRLSVWQKSNGGNWQMIAHAALIPVPERRPTQNSE